MEFVNHTRHPAHLFRSVIDETRLWGSVACRVTFDLAGGELIPAAEQVWQVSPVPWDSPRGPFPADELFYRGGADVFVFGSACPPGGRPAPRVDVTVTVADRFRHTVAVFGDRQWEKRNGTFTPTPPKAFVSLPLTLANAFGGEDIWDELPVPFPMNPVGKGFRIYDEFVPGTPLPNIEDPARLITKWDDHPDPVGVSAPPPLFGPRVARSAEVEPGTGRITKIKAMFFNAAFPDMIAPFPRPGDVVTVTGVRPNGPLRFVLPPTPVAVRVSFDDTVYPADPMIDQIGIEVDELRVFVSYRHPFKYHMIPLEVRTCELLHAG